MNRYQLVILSLFIGVFSGSACAQIFGTNLIVNGDAEAGPADPSGTSPVVIPGWAKNGSVDVLTYTSAIGINPAAGDLAPLNRGNNYFSGGPGSADTTSEIMQTIDLSAGAATIDGGNVTCSLSGYLGGTTPLGSTTNESTVSISFRDASGQQLLSSQIDPFAIGYKTGVLFQRTVAQVPPGTRSVAVTARFFGGDGPSHAFADNLSLILSAPAAPVSVLDRNLVVNGDAESGPSSASNAITPDVPGWQRSGAMSVGAYSDPNGIHPTAVGLSNPGMNFLWGGPRGGSESFQIYDVSAAAALIDTGQLTYTLSGWLGGIGANNDYTYVTLFFTGWESTTLGQSILQGPTASARQNKTEMLFSSVTGAIPAGTRVINLILYFQAPPGPNPQPPFGLADSISLVLSSTGVPSNAPAISGVTTASAFGAFTLIGGGTWIEIYGTNLAKDTRQWNASDFNGTSPPTRLDGTFVSVDSLSVPVYFISPTQVDAYLPIVSLPGQSDIVVGTPTGASAPFTITVNTMQAGLLAPLSFQVNGKQYVVALLQDGTTYVLPTGAFPGVNSRPAIPGEVISLYGTGFGPVTPSIPDGEVVSQSNSLTTPLEVSFGTTLATVLYQGLSPGSIGLYQFNVVVPSVPDSDVVPLNFKLGGQAARQQLLIAVHQ